MVHSNLCDQMYQLKLIKLLSCTVITVSRVLSCLLGMVWSPWLQTL